MRVTDRTLSLSAMSNKLWGCTNDFVLGRSVYAIYLSSLHSSLLSSNSDEVSRSSCLRRIALLTCDGYKQRRFTRLSIYTGGARVQNDQHCTGDLPRALPTTPGPEQRAAVSNTRLHEGFAKGRKEVERRDRDLES